MAEENWDLQAVVRGCGGLTTAARDPFSSFPPSSLLLEEGGAVAEADLRFCFPDLFSSQTVLQELEDLCKPFFPHLPEKQQQQPKQRLPISPQGRLFSTSTASLLDVDDGGGGQGRGLQQPLPPQQQRPSSRTPRSKRRKNQQKRVVCQVPADGLSSDMWAWRKYGQKPIKGSPFPRGYYRCSSSKGCMARKQVERSRTDPGMFFIAYAGEHNHPLPTHRNTLAGSTRHKLPLPSTSATTPGVVGDVEAEKTTTTNNKVSSPSPLSSPTVSMEEDLLLHGRRRVKTGIGGPEGEEEAEEEEGEDEDMLLVGDMEVLGEDDVLFMGLEEPHEPSSSSAAEHFSTAFSSFPWMTDNTAAAAGGSS